MSEFDPSIVQAATLAADVISQELREGFLRDIAAAKVADLPDNVTPTEVAGIIVPESTAADGVILEPRWTLVAQAEAHEAVRAATAEQESKIHTVASWVGMRLLSTDGERQAEATGDIDPQRAVFIVEGGANKTSVVRRDVALGAMRTIYGNDTRNQQMYQFGSGRKITPERNGEPNKEHQVIMSLTSGLLEPDETFTEFDANFATAIEDDYEIVQNNPPASLVKQAARHEVLLHRNHRPTLHLVQPAGPGLEGGLEALDLTDRQLVIATNGQYRPKDRLQSALWAHNRGMEAPSVVALGDEPGDVYSYLPGRIEVPNRPASAYVNELVILWRLANRVLAQRS